MDLDGNPVFSETKAFPALLESLSSLVIQLCTETIGMFCPEPMAPTNKRNKPTRLSWKVWVSFIDSLHTFVFFSWSFPSRHRHRAL